MMAVLDRKSTLMRPKISAISFRANWWKAVLGAFFMTSTTGLALIAEESSKESSEKSAFVSHVFGVIALPNGQPTSEAKVYLLRTGKGSITLPTHPFFDLVNCPLDCLSK